MMMLHERLKPIVKRSSSWRFIKNLLPRYHRPILRLGLAKARVLLQPAAKSELALAYAGLAELRLYENALPEALACCDAAIAQDPRCAAAYLHRSGALLRLGDPQQAIGALREALPRLPRPGDQSAVHLALATLLLGQHDALDALRHYELARALTPNLRWPPGDALVSGNPTEIAKKLLVFSTLVMDSVKRLELMNLAVDRLEESIPRLQAPEECLEVVYNSYMAGRYASFAEALRRYFSLMEQVALAGRRSGESEIILLNPACALGIGVMGHLTIFVKKKILLGTQERLVLCAPKSEVVNPAFLSYFRQHVEILEDPRAIAATQKTPRLPFEWGLRFDAEPKWIETIKAEVLQRWGEEHRPPLLKLDESDRARGWDALKRLGLSSGDWWVCLHVRTPAYHKEKTDSSDNFRNADIRTYYAAIKEITDRGGYVFRMGDPSMEPLPPMDRVIDYATSGIRSDWMDVFLCSQCRFYLGTNSGLTVVPNAFGVPSLITNHSALRVAAYLPQDTFVPRLLRDRSGNLLTFREMMTDPYAFAVVQGIYDGLGVRTVPNSEEELREAVVEMLGTFDPAGVRMQRPLTELQKKFNALAASAGLTLSGQVGAGFLARHEELL